MWYEIFYEARSNSPALIHIQADSEEEAKEKFEIKTGCKWDEHYCTIEEKK